MEDRGLTLDEMLWEDDFHKMINEELGDKFYQAVDEIDGTQDDVIMKLVDAFNVHIAEVYSPPRVAKLAHEYGLVPGTSFDITTNDETGLPWNFDSRTTREVQEKTQTREAIVPHRESYAELSQHS